MKNNTAKKLAESLDDRMFHEETTLDHIKQAKENDLVIVYSREEIAIFEGAIEDCFVYSDGDSVFLNDKGILQECGNIYCPYFKAITSTCANIRFLYDKAFDVSFCGINIPHYNFRITKGNRLYCLGLVFSLSDIYPSKNGVYNV